MTRYGFFDDDISDSEEPPHPVGFGTPSRVQWMESSRAATTATPNAAPSSNTRNSLFYSPGRSTYSLDLDDDDDDDDDLEFFGVFMRKQQEYPPMSSYVHASAASTPQLLQYREPGDDKDDDDEEEEDDVQRLMQQLERLQLQQRVPDITSPSKALPSQSTVTRHIQQKMDLQRKRLEQDRAAANKTIQFFVDDLNKQAAVIQQKLQAEEDAQRQRDEDERLRREAAEQKAAKLQEQQQLAKKQQEEKLLKKKEQEARVKKERQEKEAAKTEYLTKAKKLVTQLVTLRASIEPFDKNKAVSKRLLGFKKIVRGKVNTLREDAQKIQEVATDVSQAITVARQDDDQIKQGLERKDPGLTPDMARGKRYLVDLLASGVMQRVQADGFNGPRGDGFPLAAMCAMVSLENKELVPILGAHIYTVCPTAIPTLPIPAPGSSEDELMSSLGMLKDKNGEYETFDRFLTRTENIISMVADIMSSSPSTHILLGGHKGAVDWLRRFLNLLPPPPTSPLPLLTAPVLTGFLTAAGHMLANVFPDHFKKYLDIVTKDVLNRLDDGPIGKPSSIRLEKLVAGGFDSFKNTLPPRALPELYHGANGSVPQQTTGVNFSGTIGQDPAPSNNANAGGGGASPFGKPPLGAPGASPFGSGSNKFSGSFGNSSAGGGSNPFGGGGNTTSGGTPFGGGGNTAAGGMSTSSPFGGGGGTMSTENNNTFGTGDQNSMSDSTQFGGGGGGTFGNAAPFGSSSSAQPSPFGGGGFGNSNASNTTPFGGNPTSNMNQSPFGGVGQANPSPFGGGNQSNPSPFGGGATSNPSPFGGGASSNPSPFGGGAAANPSPFGGGAASNPSPFGGGASNASPFGQPGGGANKSPFGGGGGGMSGSSPFGNPSNSSPSPFGGGASPFGGGNQQGGFGNQQGGFGGGNQRGGFGGNNNNRGGGFGGNNNSNRGGGGFGGGNNNNNRKPPPCKFFAQGNCRFGNKCKFSHDTGGGGGGGFGGGGGGFGGGGGSGFGGSSPFGKPRR